MPPVELDRGFNNTAQKKRCVVARLFSVGMGAMYVDLLSHVLTWGREHITPKSVSDSLYGIPLGIAHLSDFLRSALNILAEYEWAKEGNDCSSKWYDPPTSVNMHFSSRWLLNLRKHRKPAKTRKLGLIGTLRNLCPIFRKPIR
jgi:hypothetical protein